MKLPAGVRVLEERVVDGKLLVALAVPIPSAAGRTVTAEESQGCEQSPSAAAE